MNDIEKNVLDRVHPSKKEEKAIDKAVNSLIEILENKLDEEAEPLLVGSVSKDTNLSDPDIDIFVSFPLSVSKDTMEEKILRIGREILEDTKEKYAEHPYIMGLYDGFEVDIVPCYDIDDISQMKSAVDRTPFHTEYVKDKLSEEQNDEVRLLKAFLKGIGAYGAKAKVWGFSGYLCELLILHHGSFREVLKNARFWGEEKKIEIKEGLKDFEDPLIVIDPVDTERNVASALSKEKMFLFSYASKRYLTEPKIEFFFPEDRKLKDENEIKKEIKERGTSIRAISFPTPKIVEDNLYPQIQKALRKIKKQLNTLAFERIHSDYFVEGDKTYLIFELKHHKLPSIEKHRGPPVWVQNTEEFVKKYGKKVYLEGDRLWVDRKREVTNFNDALKTISNKVDLGSDINRSIPSEIEIIEGHELAERNSSSINKFLDRSFPWER